MGVSGWAMRQRKENVKASAFVYLERYPSSHFPKTKLTMASLEFILLLVCNLQKVDQVSFSICGRRQLGGALPLVIDNEFDPVGARRQVQYRGKVACAIS